MYRGACEKILYDQNWNKVYVPDLELSAEHNRQGLSKANQKINALDRPLSYRSFLLFPHHLSPA